MMSIRLLSHVTFCKVYSVHETSEHFEVKDLCVVTHTNLPHLRIRVCSLNSLPRTRSFI